MKEDVSIQADGEETAPPGSEEERLRAEAERCREAQKETRAIIERYRETFDALAD